MKSLPGIEAVHRKEKLMVFLREFNIESFIINTYLKIAKEKGAIRVQFYLKDYTRPIIFLVV